ncbi:hypothetical protein [Leucobacter celer]|uniref:hypothetical protein n=1 Tax=Leucobacter celer TaxID=668625 RepID=UPI0012F9E25A|nr:hypothetical protein [Leucobacter celer]
MTAATQGSTRSTDRVRALGVLLLAVLLALLAAVSSATAAQAAGRVDVSAAPSADGSTTVTLTGSGFQYQPNAPGGIYVFFGAVSDPGTNSWAPSQGGRSGSTFGYASASGSQLLVGFAGGESASASNSLIDANGGWSAEMTIPGAVFDSVSGNPHAGQSQAGGQIDCLQVQCGIITIGAHGMVNANNESFTPVSFVTASGDLASGTAGQSFTDDATVIEIPDGEQTPASSEPEEAAQEPEADETRPESVEDSTTEEAAAADEGLDTSLLALGALGIAVLALLAAVVFAVFRRAKTRAVPARSTTTEEEGVSE